MSTDARRHPDDPIAGIARPAERARDLEALYRATLYEVRAPRPFVLRVGEPSPEADALLASVGAHGWAFLTAWNPRSTRASAEANALAQKRLRACVAGRALVLDGEGRAPDGSWSEESLFVAPASEEEAVAWARAFEQTAVLVGEVGGRARLVFVEA